MTRLTLEALQARLANHEPLSDVEMVSALDILSSSAAGDDDRGRFLLALRSRGEAISEITGAARFLRAQMTAIAAPAGAIDIVGTGGDGHETYNVSTCAAFVAAGAGVPVAKHGNRSVSSRSGASDVLAALGVKIDMPPSEVERTLQTVGIGFLWAPMYHPAMKVWAPARAALKVRTLFNLLGPICNPANVRRQVVGVFEQRWIEPIAHVLQDLGSQHAWVVHGNDGLDELSTTGATSVAELRDGQVRLFEVTPEDAGLARASLADLKGGDASHNAAALRRVLDGDTSAYRDIVVLNAAAALIVAGKAATLIEGARLAVQSIDSGGARAALARLIAISTAV